MTTTTQRGQRFYKFAVLDPQAKMANDAIFAEGPVYGIEITVPELAARCVVNIDPQHSVGNSNEKRAAIEIAAQEGEPVWLPPTNAILATIRPDLDSLGTMAVFELRKAGLFGLEDHRRRVAAIAASDKSDRGEWSPKSLPQPGDLLEPDPEKSKLLGLARLVADFKRPIDERVGFVEDYILNGTCPGLEESIAKLRKERDEAIAASRVYLYNSNIAVVESRHRGAIGLGYCLAPIVVAVNEAFQLAGGEPHKKFTIAQFREGFIDLRKIAEELNKLERGWGGTSTIIGSPQGVSSKLTLEEVVEVVQRGAAGQ